MIVVIIIFIIVTIMRIIIMIGSLWWSVFELQRIHVSFFKLSQFSFAHLTRFEIFLFYARLWFWRD